jgi:hypothetical protein
VTASTREEEASDAGIPALTAATVFPSLPTVAAQTRAVLTLSRCILLAAVCAGTVLRFLSLNSVGLNSDEAVYASQGASLAGNPNFSGLFPIVRAHPLLLQMLVSPMYEAGRPDAIARYVAAAFGVGTILMVYAAGRVMFGALTGSVAALLLAVMPYHVTVTRQFLLDGPMTFFTTAALACMAKAMAGGSRRWMVAAGTCIGLGALCKETGLVLLIAIFAFLAVYARAWRPVRFPVFAGLAALGLIFAYPALTAISGGSGGGQSYLLWQLTRQPNHSFGFYPATVGAAMGFLVLAIAGYGLLVRPPTSWREKLLLSWIVVPLLYFEVWPVKGFAYLLPLAPAVALLAARGIAAIGQSATGARRRLSTLLAGLITVVCTVVLAVPASAVISNDTQTTGLAGGGGTPGGRETGRWIAVNLPPKAAFMTIGPSMANLIRYYTGRRADGLSVSPNPLHRNPSYQAILNPDGALRAGAYQYIVWDTYSAERSKRFANEATSLAQRFHARLVHAERGSDGSVLIAVYQVSATHAKFSAAHPAPTMVVHQPNRAILYGGYGAAVAAAIALLLWGSGLLRRFRPAAPRRWRTGTRRRRRQSP